VFEAWEADMGRVLSKLLLADGSTPGLAAGSCYYEPILEGEVKVVLPLHPIAASVLYSLPFISSNVLVPTK
jgi:hypothetical protein